MGSQVLDRVPLRIELCVGTFSKLFEDALVAFCFLFDPATQPAAYIPTTRHCRKLIKFPKKLFLRETLEHAEPKGCAANAAAGKAKSGAGRIGGVNPFNNRFETLLFFKQIALSESITNFTVQFLLENVGKRLRFLRI